MSPRRKGQAPKGRANRSDPVHRARLERAATMFTPRAELDALRDAAMRERCAEAGHRRRRVVVDPDTGGARTVCESCGADLGAVAA